jgi:hypothetical protein
MVRKADARSTEAIAAYAALLNHAGTSLANSAGIAGDDWVVGQWSESMPMPSDEATEMLDEAVLIGGTQDDAAQAKQSLVGGKAKYARLRLLQRLRRDFDLGLLDLLRNHIVSSMGYLRVQSETAALAVAIAENPSVGSEWWDALTLDAGRAFHRKHNPRLRELMKRMGLDLYYQLGSEMAMHSRLAGVINGILYGGESEKTETTVSIKITYQDFDDAKRLFLYFANYLLAHHLIAKALPDCIPEVKSAELGVVMAAYMTPAEGVLDTARRILSASQQRGE